MTDTTQRLRGRRGQERRIAERFAPAARPTPSAAESEVGSSTVRHRLPDLSALSGPLAKSGEVGALVDRLKLAGGGRAGQDLRHVIYAAMPHGTKTFLAAAFLRASGERLVWVARDSEIADRVAEELTAWLGDPSLVVTLEPRTALAYERSELVLDESAARVAALAAWRSGQPRVLVASVHALFQHTLQPAALPATSLELRPRQRMSQERVLRELVALGYESLPEVGGRGEFARRGGIVDVFPAGEPLPVRIEWFGDEIDSLRSFDPADQRGVRPAESVRLLPASEFALPAGSGTRIAERLGRLAARLPEALADDLARFENGQLGDAAEVWAPLIAPATALDHLADEILLLDEAAEVGAVATFLTAQSDERRSELERGGNLPKGWPVAYPAPRDWKKRLAESRTIELTWETDVRGAPPGGNPFGWHEPVLPPAGLGDLAATVDRWRHEGLRVVLTSDQSARLTELLSDANIVAAPVSVLREPPPAGGIALIDRSLNSGFAGGPEQAVVVTDRELFGTVRVRRPRVLRRSSSKGVLERLQPGDLVVHIDHGIAKYTGLVRRASGDGSDERDFLELHFAEGARIWVAGSGRAPRRVFARRSRTWPRTCSSSTRRASGPTAGRSATTRPGSRRWKRHSRTRRRSTSCARRRRSRPTSSVDGRWTGWSWATLVTARPRWRCAPRSR
jgi:transcription-repair coupling factor (superfamily II helicase)